MNTFILRMSHVNNLVQEGLNSNEIIIGWSEAAGLLDPNLKRADFKNILYKKCSQPGQNYRKAGNATGSVWRFIRDMQIGDLVIVPWRSNYYVAEITGPPKYEHLYAVSDTAYRRDVLWLNNKAPIPKKYVNHCLQSITRAQQTCTGPFDLSSYIRGVINADQIEREVMVNTCVDRILNALNKDCFIINQGTAKGQCGGVVLSPKGKETIAGLKPYPGYVQKCEEGEEILGTYQPMCSPGIITLHVPELTSYYWHLIADILNQGHQISWNDLEHLAYMVTIKTYKHEQFHHFCDVSQHLFSNCYNYIRNIEEALAVAHSYIEVTLRMRTKRSNRIGKISKAVYQAMLDRIFVYYQPGYRDWINYKTISSYQAGLLNYIKPHSAGFLESNGINMSDILGSISLEVKNQGVIEKLRP